MLRAVPAMTFFACSIAFAMPPMVRAGLGVAVLPRLIVLGAGCGLIAYGAVDRVPLTRELEVLAAIAEGEIDLAFRRWERPRVRAGGTQRTSAGVIGFDLGLRTYEQARVMGGGSILAGLVLGAAGGRTLVWPPPASGPFPAVLVTPDLASAALSFGADEATWKVFAAAAVALPFLIAAFARPRGPIVLAAQFLAALELVVAVALIVSGVRDV